MTFQEWWKKNAGQFDHWWDNYPEFKSQFMFDAECIWHDAIELGKEEKPKYNDIVSILQGYFLPVYINERYRQFCVDMYTVGFENNLRHYKGRNYYEGPAVICDNVDEISKLTEVPLQWDNFGLKYVVYPKG